VRVPDRPPSALTTDETDDDADSTAGEGEVDREDGRRGVECGGPPRRLGGDGVGSGSGCAYGDGDAAAGEAISSGRDDPCRTGPIPITPLAGAWLRAESVSPPTDMRALCVRVKRVRGEAL
jgi:hypothetical protein